MRERARLRAACSGAAAATSEGEGDGGEFLLCWLLPVLVPAPLLADCCVLWTELSTVGDGGMTFPDRMSSRLMSMKLSPLLSLAGVSLPVRPALASSTCTLLRSCWVGGLQGCGIVGLRVGRRQPHRLQPFPQLPVYEAGPWRLCIMPT
eukprot:scaffold93687_cov16-Tisochrysis_lutea.AAC.1